MTAVVWVLVKPSLAERREKQITRLITAARLVYGCHKDTASGRLFTVIRVWAALVADNYTYFNNVHPVRAI